MLSSCAAQGIRGGRQEQGIGAPGRRRRPGSDMDLEEFGLDEGPLQDVGAGPAPSRRLSRASQASQALCQWTSMYSKRVKLVWIVGRSPPHVSLDDLDKDQLNMRVRDWMCDHSFAESFPDVGEIRQCCFGMLLIQYRSSMPTSESPYALPLEKRIQSGWQN